MTNHIVHSTLLLVVLMMMIWCGDTAVSYLPDIDYYDLDGGRTTLTLFGFNNDSYPIDDLYIDIGTCSGTGVAPILQTCCTIDVVENCTYNFDLYCLDESTSQQNIIVDSLKYETIYSIGFKILNYDECDQIVFSLRELIGSHIFRIKVPTYYRTYIGGYYTDTFEYCCADLVSTTEHRFDGEIIVDVYSNLYASELRSIKAFKFDFHTPKQVNGLYLVPFNYFHRYKKISFLLENQPLDISYESLGNLINPLYETFNRGLRTTIAERSDTHYFYIDTTESLYLADIHLDPEFRIQFSNLFTLDGQAVSSLFHVFPMELNCSSTSLQNKITELENGLDKVKNNNVDSTKALSWFWSYAVSPTLSLEWISCQRLTFQALTETYETDVLANTEHCIHPFNSEEYMEDPCCNPSLSQCCSQKLINTTLTRFSIDDDSVSSTCNPDAIKCVENALDRVVGNVRPHNSFGSDIVQDDCDRIFQAYQTYLDNLTPTIFTQCKRRIIPVSCDQDADCESYLGVGSVCDWNSITSFSTLAEWERTCKVPCTTDSDCAHGKCLEQAGTNFCYQPYLIFDININSDQVNFLMVQCLAEKTNLLEPFLRVNFFKELGLNLGSNLSEIESALASHLLEDGCNPYATPAQNPKPESYCTTIQGCNWLPCDSFENEYCHAGNISILGTTLFGCDDGALRSGSLFCGKQHPSGFISELTQSGNCLRETSPYFELGLIYCDDYNGRLDDLTLSCWTGPYNTTSECLQDYFCPFTTEVEKIRRFDGIRIEPEFSTGEYCPRTCVLDGYSQQACDDVGGVWIYNPKVLMNQCHLAVAAQYNTTFDDRNYCLSIGGLHWGGATYFPDKWTDECDSFCRYSPSTLVTEDQCNNGYHCTNAFCYTDNSNCTQQECTDSGFCSSGHGCFTAYLSDGTCESGVWTPEGCLDKTISDFLCPSYGGFFRTFDEWRALTKTDCELLSVSCHITTDIQRTSDLTPKPWIITKSEEDCSSCNGIYQSDYSWIKGEWVENYQDWIQLDWSERQMINAYSYGQIISELKFNSLLNSAKVSRETDIINNILRCSIGDTKVALAQITCLCFGDDSGDGNTCISDIGNGVALGTEKACSLLPYNASFPQFGSLNIGNNFILESDGCIEVELRLYPLSYFSQRDTISLVRIPSTQDDRDKYTNVLNSHKVIIGEIIGDGVFISLDTDIDSITDLELCFQTLSVDETVFSGVIIGVTSDTNERVSILDPESEPMSVDTNSFCFSITSSDFSDKIYFPIGLHPDTTTETLYISTFSAGEAFVLVLGGIIYIVFTLAAAAFLGVFILEHFKSNEESPFWTTATISLTFLLLLGLNRFLFVMFVTGDVLYQQPVLSVVFSEVPALFFFSIISLTIFRWAEFTHFKMADKNKIQKSGTGIVELTPYLTILNILLYIAVIIFAILVGVLESDSITVTCTTTEEELTALTQDEVVALIYIIFFSAVSFALLLGLIFYGFLILSRLAKLGESKFRTDHTLLTRSIIGVCSVFLVLQIVLLLSRSIRDWNWTVSSSLIFLYIADVPGLIFFLYMFRIPMSKLKREHGTRSTKE